MWQARSFVQESAGGVPPRVLRLARVLALVPRTKVVDGQRDLARGRMVRCHRATSLSKWSASPSPCECRGRNPTDHPLKNSSCSLLDLTRSEWFLPRWRPELLRFLRHLLTGRQDFKGRKLQRSEKFSS